MDTGTVVTPPYVAGPLQLAPFRGLRLYLHEYTVNGGTVRGLVGALDVSRRAAGPAQRAVLPHEGIHPAQADNLADRMHQMDLNPAPILLVQDSPAQLRQLLRRQREATPDSSFVDRAGCAHRLWNLSDPLVLETIAELLAPTTAVIADGHHRYSVDDVAVAARSVGIVTRPAHQAEALAALCPGVLIATDNQRWLRVHVGARPDRVEIETLHDRLVPALGHGPTRITHHHSAADALSHAHRDDTTAILLPAPRFDQVQRVAEADRLFPEKATSFQPKPPLGVLLRRVHDEGGEPPTLPPRRAKRSRQRS